MSMIKNISKVFSFILVLVFIFSSCDKNNDDNDGWTNCTQCDTESWIGEYSGTGDYNNFNNNSNINNVDVSVVIEETAADYLTVYFQVPSTYSTTVSGDFSNSYVVSFAGSGSTYTATMFIKDNELKMTGSSKKFHYKNDTILVIDQVVTFETIKIQ